MKSQSQGYAETFKVPWGYRSAVGNVYSTFGKAHAKAAAADAKKLLREAHFEEAKVEEAGGEGETKEGTSVDPSSNQNQDGDQDQAQVNPQYGQLSNRNLTDSGRRKNALRRMKPSKSRHYQHLRNRQQQQQQQQQCRPLQTMTTITMPMHQRPV